MIDNKFLKVGQRFMGNVNGAKFKIIDITRGLKGNAQQSPTQQKTIYIYTEDENGREFSTNLENFKRLQITPTKGD